MKIEKPIIKTYSRRQPVTRFESSAAFIPSYTDPTHVRESRLNDKTLVVENFNDTFDRLATGVVVPSPENSLDENGVVKEKDSDIFFKVPLQAEKSRKPKPRGKTKKKDLLADTGVSVKRKKVDVDSDDSDSSDQEKKYKKSVANANDKKSEVKLKKVVKRKKDLSSVKDVINDEYIVSENADENLSNNIENYQKQNIKADDNFKKPEVSKVNQSKLLNYFQASTPTVNRIQTNMNVQNKSPVNMAKDIEKDTELVLLLSEPDLQVDQNVVFHNEDSISEYLNKDTTSNENNTMKANDNFIKPKGITMPHHLKASNNLLTSTPRENKIRMPINLQNLSPIISDKEIRFSGELNEKSTTVNNEQQPSSKNGVGESNLNDDVQIPFKEVMEPVKSPTKLSKVQDYDVENDCSKQSDNVKRNEVLLSQKETDASESSEHELLVSNKANENKTQDNRTSENNLLEANCQNNLLVPTIENTSSSKQLLNKTPPINKEFSQNTGSFAQSPLLFDDSEYNQSHVGQNNVVQNSKEDINKIDFSQDLFAKVDENKKETVNLEDTNVEPPSHKAKICDISTESSFYPHDWTNDYDSTYNYDQHKMNSETDKSIDSKLDEHEEKDLTCVNEKINSTSIESVTESNEVSNIENTEIQFIDSQEQEKIENTIWNKDNNTEEDITNKLNEQEENITQIDNISNKDNHDSIHVEQENVQNNQIIIEEKQPYCANKSLSLDQEPDESFGKSNNQDLEDQSVILRPSKRRRTNTSEVIIFDKVENNDIHISTSNGMNDETKITESTNDDVLIKPNYQYEQIIEKIHDKELRIILSKVDDKIADYKLPIFTRRKSAKRKSGKRLSKKSSETDDEFTPSKSIQEEVKLDVGRVTRSSVTEDKMRKLYEQFQCKEFSIYAMRLEDQGINLQFRRSLKRKSRENTIFVDNELDSSLTSGGGLSDFLSKLNDPMKIAMRRKTHRKYDRHLAAITENQAGLISEEEMNKEEEMNWGNDKRVTFNTFRKNSEVIEYIDRKSQPIFLKPGKSWARSLSIINHFHNGKNLDELAAGRENWRHSVQTVLNMQPEVTARSSYHNLKDRDSRSSYISQRGSKSIRKSSIATSPNRYSRLSIRIIPGGKRSTLTDDVINSQRISYVSDRSRVSRKTSLKIRRDTLIETEDDLIKSAKDIILKRCNQTSYEPFNICFPDSYIDKCLKIGEGVYGEVFLYENGAEKSVIKIIPIEGDQLVNCEPQKKFHEILSEIIIAEELHKLRFDNEFNTNGFVEVNRIMCVIGKYPEKLIDLWYAYDEQKQSENDCPSMFEEDQLYIILELAHGGQDLEAYTFQNASESYAIFLQTALTLAVAEQSLEFEHRDLHWGNILISKTNEKNSTYNLGRKEISLPTKGVKVAVIDFTLSRMAYQGCKIFNDLAADPTLFEAQGEYQFDIYRMMRDKVDNDWQQFNPFTNVLWMDYTLDKMITAVKYKKKTTKIHKSAIEDMKVLRKEILKYESAFEFVTNCKKVQALFNST